MEWQTNERRRKGGNSYCTYCIRGGSALVPPSFSHFPSCFFPFANLCFGFLTLFIVNQWSITPGMMKNGLWRPQQMMQRQQKIYKNGHPKSRNSKGLPPFWQRPWRDNAPSLEILGVPSAHWRGSAAADGEMDAELAEPQAGDGWAMWG